MSCHLAKELDLLGYQDSPLKRLDARVKLIFTLFFVIIISSYPKYSLSALIPFFFFPVFLASLGRVPIKLLLRLIVLASPFVLVIALLNPLFDPLTVKLTANREISAGWISGLSIMIRFTLCLSMLGVLVASTSFAGILQALRTLGLPAAFVAQLQFLYRYLFVLLDEAKLLLKARSLRDPHSRLPSLNTAKALLGTLLSRTWDRAERICGAMLLRGFSGEIPLRNLRPASYKDLSLLCLGLCSCLLLRFYRLEHFLGNLMLGVWQ